MDRKLIRKFTDDLSRSENGINNGDLPSPAANPDRNFDFALPSLDGDQSGCRSQILGSEAHRKRKSYKFPESAYLFVSESWRTTIKRRG